jgi:hypothetical protein
MSKDEIKDKLYWLIKECLTYPDLADKLAPTILELKQKLRNIK